MNSRRNQKGAAPGRPEAKRIAADRPLAVRRPGRRAVAEARLVELEASAPDLGAWARGLVEQIDPRGSRDLAIREAAQLVGGDTRHARARELETLLGRYLSGRWIRTDRDLAAPPTGLSRLRILLWRIAKLTDGEGLAWRRIYDLIEKTEE